MIRRAVLTLLLTAIPVTVLAGPADNPKVEKWMRRAMTQCPSPTWEFASVDQPLPAGLAAYRLREVSESANCRETAFALVTESGQILAGQIVPLGNEPVSAAVKIKALFTERMKMDVDVEVTASPLKDGIREVIIRKKSPTGVVPIRGWLDASQRLFVLGRRGDIERDAGATLLDDLEASRGASKGPSNAQIRIVELSDLQCPSCRRGHEIMAPMLKKYGDRIHYTRLDLPISDSHDWTMRASQAAVSIQKLAPEHYWGFVDYIFANQPTITAATIDEVVRDYVTGVGIDWTKFEKQYESKALRSDLNDQVGRAFSNGIFATPTFLVNGRSIFYGPGGAELEAYMKMIMGE